MPPAFGHMPLIQNNQTISKLPPKIRKDRNGDRIPRQKSGKINDRLPICIDCHIVTKWTLWFAGWKPLTTLTVKGAPWPDLVRINLSWVGQIRFGGSSGSLPLCFRVDWFAWCCLHDKHSNSSSTLCYKMHEPNRNAIAHTKGHWRFQFCFWN